MKGRWCGDTSWLSSRGAGFCSTLDTRPRQAKRVDGGPTGIRTVGERASAHRKLCSGCQFGEPDEEPAYSRRGYLHLSFQGGTKALAELSRSLQSYVLSKSCSSVYTCASSGLGGGTLETASFPKCQKCSKGDLVPLSDFGSQGASIRYKAWVCTNPDCGYNIKIRNGEVYLNEPVLSGELRSRAR